jgi:hypothetical protein
MNQTRTSGYKDPTWWNDNHSSAWERTKEALRRDWEQTKADVSDGGHELNQNVGDTVKQSAGKQPIPPGNMPNPASASERDTWNDVEPALRYGYGARHHYGSQDWNDDLERKLRKDWDDTGDPSAWERVKAAVRRGWESVTS